MSLLLYKNQIFQDLSQLPNIFLTSFCNRVQGEITTKKKYFKMESLIEFLLKFENSTPLLCIALVECTNDQLSINCAFNTGIKIRFKCASVVSLWKMRVTDAGGVLTVGQQPLKTSPQRNQLTDLNPLYGLNRDHSKYALSNVVSLLNISQSPLKFRESAYDSFFLFFLKSFTFFELQCYLIITSNNEWRIPKLPISFKVSCNMNDA